MVVAKAIEEKWPNQRWKIIEPKKIKVFKMVLGKTKGYYEAKKGASLFNLTEEGASFFHHIKRERVSKSLSTSWSGVASAILGNSYQQWWKINSNQQRNKFNKGKLKFWSFKIQKQMIERLTWFHTLRNCCGTLFFSLRF